MSKAAGEIKNLPQITQMNAEKISVEIGGKKESPADYADNRRKNICGDRREKKSLPLITQIIAEKISAWISEISGKRKFEPQEMRCET